MSPSFFGTAVGLSEVDGIEREPEAGAKWSSSSATIAAQKD